LALLGVDYPADAWRLNILRRMVPDFAAALSVTLLAMALCWVLNERLRLSKLNRRLAVDEALFRAVFDQAPIGIAVVRQDSYAFEGLSGNSGINRMFERITGRPRGELVKLKWLDITHPDDIPASLDGYERVKSGQAAGYSAEKRYVRPDGSVVWVNVMISRLVSGDSGAAYFLALLEDITARRQAEDALRESERSKAVLLSHLPGLAYRCRFDRQWTMEFVSEGCLALTGYPPEALLNNRDLSYNDLIAPEDRERLWDAWQTVLAQRESFRQEYQIVTRTGRRKWVLELGQGIYGGDGSVTALEGIVIDITSQKENEARILYLSEHDTLTGLHNRLYYERAQRSLDAQSALPLSVVVCDIDGLHLVNDVFGLEQGDRLIVESARLIQDVRREGDELIRTGGDEFTLIMPRTEAAAAEKVVRRIREAVQAYNAGLEKPACELSLSAGSCTRVSQAFSFAQTVKAAQENMHYHKLLVRRSPHSAILSSVMATMLERSRETEAHGERLVSLSKQLGGRLGLGQKAMDELELYAMLHDIGKVGVDDRILNKPGKLTSEEWESMKKHSEIGYRIAASATELAHVADYILSHHERWDGTGYPDGLKGEDIPLLARAIAICDAYQAMVVDRPYRRALSQTAALAQLRACSGTQFDPQLVEVFIGALQKQAAPS